MMRNHPEVACKSCGRQMNLISFHEDTDSAIVECPLCGLRELISLTPEVETKFDPKVAPKTEGAKKE